LLLAAPSITRAQTPTPAETPGPRDAVLLTLSGTVEIAPAGATTSTPGHPNQILHLGDQISTGKASRASVRLSDKSVLRVYELTKLEIKPPQEAGHNDVIDVKSGATYFFNRDKPQETQFQTPSASGAIRGTEFNLVVKDDGTTELTLLDGQVDLTNQAGGVQLQSGEQAKVIPGQAPQKSPTINAVNIIQWTLYYPAILDVDELQMPSDLQTTLAPSLDAYRGGDLLQALAKYPSDRTPSSEVEKVYRAALLLAVGQVDDAQSLLQGSMQEARPAALASALQEMIASVKGEPFSRTGPRTLATEWLAGSYAAQAHRDLVQSLAMAQSAATQSPNFGFALERVAEMEFSFGHTDQALAALQKSLAVSPRNAQALALEGFVVSAQNKIALARGYFERAIALDGALANGWLGRGLTRIKSGAVDEGRKDLEMAVTLEPTRAFLHSYLGKAWSLDEPFQYGWNTTLAMKDLRRAKELDPNDPTAWLYSALLNDQHNSINQALDDLEHSQDLNGNRAVFRSKFLLDQDAAVRSANLALIYQDAGFNDLALREATRAVESDYANYSAHLFLSESYDALIDPEKQNNRYETPWESELLLADLLAPVGAGVVSPNISQQEYSRMFEADRFGISSETTYWSRGALEENGSQYGTKDNMAYSLDGYYYTDPGIRPNNYYQNSDLSATVKYAITPKDTVFAQVEQTEIGTGDNGQFYNDYTALTAATIKGGGFSGGAAFSTSQEKAGFDPNIQNHEVQDPNIVLGYHHQWSPGNDTLFVYRNLQDIYTLSDPILYITTVNEANGTAPYQVNYQDKTVLNSMELQHIYQTDSQRLILGGRYQVEDHDTSNNIVYQTFNPVNVSSADDQTEFNRLTFYAYYQLTLLDHLRLTAGATYDRMRFPDNIANAPIAGTEERRDRISPKAGIDWTPDDSTRFRAAYTRSMGGLFNDSSSLIEPSEVAGFNQAYRTLLEQATLPGTQFETEGVAAEHKFPTRTYVSIEGDLLNSTANQQIGFQVLPFFPTLTTQQETDYKEKDVILNLDQLIGDELSVGLAYHLTSADVNYNTLGVAGTGLGSTKNTLQSTLHETSLFANYNLPCGFFSQFQANWWDQSNKGFSPNEPGDDFWQFNIFAGYRFPRRHMEIQVGVLNLANQNYSLDPLTFYLEQVHTRTFVTSFKFNF
jgi:tetratricopeptide (TPR) repeat protein